MPAWDFPAFLLVYLKNECENKVTKKGEHMDTDILVGFGTLGIVFFLVVILGLQIQISTLTRRIDELIDEVRKK